jgi:hypothetical protein
MIEDIKIIDKKDCSTKTNNLYEQWLKLKEKTKRHNVR